MSKTLKIVGVCGSLRKASPNLGLLRVAQRLCPAGAEVEILDISSLPLFNPDLEPNVPQPVLEMRAKIDSADALLLASPEYNYSVATPMKNFIDWASRTYAPAKTHPLFDKPAAIMSVGGGLGGSRGQYHLRQILVFLNVHPINKPEVAIQRFAGGKDNADANGDLPSEMVDGQVSALVQALVDWTRRIAPQPKL
eukprot:tig00000870_g5150.t1